MNRVGMEEITQTARQCAERECDNCERLRNDILQEDDCRRALLRDAASVIERLQARQQETDKALSREGFADLPTMIAKYKQVMADANEISIARDADLERVTRERDAAKTALREVISRFYTDSAEIDCKTERAIARCKMEDKP